MKTLLLLSMSLGASALAAQSLTEIQGIEIPVERVRQSYSHTARTDMDEIWTHSYSDTLKGRDRVIVLYLVAANRAGTRERTGREWELPYDGLAVNAISLADAPKDGAGTITLEAGTRAGGEVVCTLFYGFGRTGKLRSGLTDAGCVDKVVE